MTQEHSSHPALALAVTREIPWLMTRSRNDRVIYQVKLLDQAYDLDNDRVRNRVIYLVTCLTRSFTRSYTGSGSWSFPDRVINQVITGSLTRSFAWSSAHRVTRGVIYRVLTGSIAWSTGR